MVFRSLPTWLLKGRGRLLLLVILLWLCEPMLPTAARAGQTTSWNAPAATSVSPAPFGATLLLPEPPPDGTPVAPASPTASPSVTSTSQVEPTPSPTFVASAEPEVPASAASSQPPPPAGTPTPASPTAKASAVAPAQPSPTSVAPVDGTTAVVAAQALHLREGPGARYPIRAIYGRGTPVQVLGRNHAGLWLRVVTPDERAGWMAVSALKLDEQVANLLIVDGALPPDDGSDVGLSSDQGHDPTGSTSRAPGDSGIVASAEDVAGITDAPEGLAVVTVEQTILHIAPGTRSEGFQPLHQDEQVKLLGQARGAWVRVQAFTSVVPGWVYAADLRPLPGAIEGAPLITTTVTLSTTATVTPAIGLDSPVPRPTPSPTAPPTMAVVEAIPEPHVVETAAPPPPRLPVEITVEVVEATAALSSRRGGPTATPATGVGVAGMRVQIVTVFGDVLVEAITPDTGRVTFTRDLPADLAVYVQIPALGLHTQLPPEDVTSGTAHLTVAIPR